MSWLAVGDSWTRTFPVINWFSIDCKRAWSAQTRWARNSSGSRSGSVPVCQESWAAELPGEAGTGLDDGQRVVEGIRQARAAQDAPALPGWDQLAPDHQVCERHGPQIIAQNREGGNSCQTSVGSTQQPDGNRPPVISTAGRNLRPTRAGRETGDVGAAPRDCPAHPQAGGLPRWLPRCARNRWPRCARNMVFAQLGGGYCPNCPTLPLFCVCYPLIMFT